MDNTRLVITETHRFDADSERKAYIQKKIDKWIKQQLEREDLSYSAANPSPNEVR